MKGHDLVDDALRILDAIHSSGRMEYGDYSQLHDAISEINVGENSEAHTENMIEIPASGIKDVSDGYHTFRSLYDQRLVLTAALVRVHKEIAWKSKLHADGEEPFGGRHFVVGFSTPAGEYTYHYNLEHWDMFDCQELPLAKPWDGHTDKDVRRLLSIQMKDVTEHG